MQFLNAIFLWAGFAVLIPPIIHLFNFRRYKTIYFSDVRFLQNLKNITRQRSTIKQILLMILRMLIIACLVIAFAQPVIYKGNQDSDLSAVKTAPPIIYIDNSFSMQAGEISGLNLENAKNKALEIVDAFPRETDFLFITNDFLQKHNHFVKADGIRMFLQETKLTPNVPTIAQVINKSVQNLNFLDIEPNCQKNIFVISDFQKNICDFEELSHDSTIAINLIPIKSKNINNVSIDTCEFLTPYRMHGSEEEVSVTVQNYGNKVVTNIPIKLYINGNNKCAETFSLNPYERKNISLKYLNTERNIVKGKISIQDSPIAYDNDLYFTYKIDSLKNILIIGDNEDKKYYLAMFGKNPNFKTDVITDPTNTNFSDYQTIIINETENIPHTLSGKIQNYVANGGNVIFVPSYNGNINDYNYLLSSMQCNTFISKDTIKCKVSKINQQSLLLRNAIREIPENADLPYITKYFNSTNNSYQGEDIILESDSYKKIVTSNEYRGGKFYVFYTPLNTKSGNLVTHRLIAPLLYNAATITQNYSQQYYSVIGNDNGFSTKIENFADGTPIILKSEDSETEFIPRVSGPDAFMNFKIFSENCVEKHGFYNLLVEQRLKNSIAYNYNRKESQLEFLDANKIEKNLHEKGFEMVKVIDSEKNSFTIEAVQNAATQPIWKIFIIFAIIFAFFEIIICRVL
ncbi:MAG: BatA domain-containing protein [Bacteroidales bacterium]|nr:BatA domain-containing protein [Bacteroidales bacterium]